MTGQPMRLAISMGDYNGIGPEIILKTLSNDALTNSTTPIIFGSEKVFRFYLDQCDLDIRLQKITSPEEAERGVVNIIDVIDESQIVINPGGIDVRAGKAAVAAIKEATLACLNDLADAIVTAPISKEAVNKAGFPHPGHTEYLAELCKTSDFVMLLVHDGLRVGLVTIHIPLHSVKEQISEESITERIAIIHRGLINDFGLERPRIAILGLNPHAGDGGVIGREELDVIIPAINSLQKNGFRVDGPFPADGFFGSRQYELFDAVLAMYHDQGLIPFKTIAFHAGVNVTLGLPIVRTSPDHGTAFALAGKNQAEPQSFREAVELAAKIVNNRKHQHA
ncbi:MAG TPA: 4-hydroxythreonine-4-phosphate dehydrogenase PdxA [Balneolales bacterium]|nr:4-hydroxythreonine-4-phosphate dehydrogenase PdxA [Balneolales bacterium]